jgi:hypothetical protein
MGPIRDSRCLVSNSSTSKWIGPRPNTADAAGLAADAGEGAGNYVYRTQVDLTNFNLSSVQIQGNFGSDNNCIAVRVNGVEPESPTQASPSIL